MTQPDGLEAAGPDVLGASGLWAMEEGGSHYVCATLGRMGKTSALSFDLSGPNGLDRVLSALDDLSKPEKTLNNAIMRDMSHTAAQQLVPLVQSAVNRSPAPQARALAGTVRAKRDRMIVVKIGATNPKLSGFRRASGNKVWRGSLAWGVAVGPGPRRAAVSGYRTRRRARVAAHRRDGAAVRSYYQPARSVAAHSRQTTNVYGIGRAGSADDPFSGYLAGARGQIEDASIDAYGDIMREICRRLGLPIAE